MTSPTTALLTLDPDPSDTQRAVWDALASSIDAVADRDAPPPNVDAVAVAWKAAHLVSAWSTPPLSDALASLPATMFDPASPPRIEALAKALSYASRRRDMAAAQATKAQVDPAVLRAAFDTRRRMLLSAALFFDDAPAVKKTLRLAASGKTRLEVMEGLCLCASLYEEHRDRRPTKDFGLYRADDDVRARRLAATILGSAREGDAVTLWTRRVAKAWALLRATYEPLRAAVTFLQGPSRAPAPTLNQLRDVKKRSRPKKS